MYYAQLDDENKVKAITESNVPVIGDNIIQIQSYDLSLLRATWDGVNFIPAVVPKKINFADLIRSVSIAKQKQLFALAESNEDIKHGLNMIYACGIGKSDESWVDLFLTALVAIDFITQNQKNNLMGV